MNMDECIIVSSVIDNLRQSWNVTPIFRFEQLKPWGFENKDFEKNLMSQWRSYGVVATCLCGGVLRFLSMAQWLPQPKTLGLDP